MSKSMISVAVTLAVLFVASTFSLESEARAWGWAKRLPVNHYSAEDIAIVRPLANETLESGANGQAVRWQNPATGHSGSITPLTDVEQGGKRCRQARFSATTQGGENLSEFFLCRQPDGVWAVEQPQAE